MAINLDHVTEQITVTDTATNADLTLVSKGTGAVKATNATNMIVYSAGQSGYGSFLAQGSTGNNAYYFGYSGSSEVGRITMGASNAVDFATSSAATLQLRVNHTASAVNYLQATGQPAGFGPLFSSQGSDTNINMVYLSKGSGGHGFGTNGGSFIQQFAVTHTASAVNYVQATGAATGSGPTISVQGSDTNLDLNVTAKGTGGARFNVGNGVKYTYLSSDAANNTQLIGAVGGNLGIYATSAGSIRFYTTTGLSEEQLRIAQTVSAVNYHQFTGSATGNAVVHSAQGSDTNIDLAFTPKGTGNVRFGTYTGTILTPTGYVEIKDSGGTVRRLLVG